MKNVQNSIQYLYEILKFERKEIVSIYIYSFFSGLLQLAIPLGIQSIISFVLGGSISTSIVILILLVISSVVVGGYMQVAQMKIIEKIQQQLFLRYSFEYAYKIPHLNLKSVDGHYLPKVTNQFLDSISLQKGISKILLDVPSAMLQVLFGLLLLSFYHPVFIGFGILLVVVVLLILRFTGQKGFETSMQESKYKYKTVAYLQDVARTVTSFKFSRNTSYHVERTDHYVTNYLKARTAHFKILLTQYWTLIIFKVVITAVMLIVGVVLLIDLKINIGQFIASEIIILTVISSVEKIISSLEKVYDVMTSLEKVNELLEKPNEATGDYKLDEKTKINISFDKVSFGYLNEQKVVKNLSFEINQGEVVSIMGRYSSGKTTLLKLLAGTHHVDEGTFTINGIPIVNYHTDSLRKYIGVLFQHYDIIHGSLLENILMDEDVSLLPEVTKISKVVGLDQFVSTHKDGYDMQLLQNGQHLSGKIVKKILLMRALIKKPKLLLLEEPWLGLDYEDIENIKKYLLNEMKGTTIVVVHNEPEFALVSNKVLMLEQGEITFNGLWSDFQSKSK